MIWQVEIKITQHGAALYGLDMRFLARDHAAAMAFIEKTMNQVGVEKYHVAVLRCLLDD